MDASKMDGVKIWQMDGLLMDGIQMDGTNMDTILMDGVQEQSSYFSVSARDRFMSHIRLLR